MICPADVIDFWFRETAPRQWWTKDEGFDATVRERFAALHAAAAQGELFAWRTTAEGRLAEIIVLDQFSRNLHRDDAGAFAQDAMALVLAQEAVAQGVDQQLPVMQRHFLYMPYMHSESALIQVEAEKLFRELGLEETYAIALRHKEIVDRFGRYPHRNAMLGRLSTAEEIDFLRQPGSSF